MTQPNVWKVAPVKEQPSLTLVHWSILEIEAGTRHLSGYCLENREGRASTAIVKFDPATMRCDTQSGRVYQLQGGPGEDADAEYVWTCWAAVNGAKRWKDVTEEVLGDTRKEPGGTA